MSVTADTNILVYASNTDDPAHRPSRDLVDRLLSGPDLVYLFWPVLIGYLRIVTHPSILPRPLRPVDAAANVSALLEGSHVRAPGEGDQFWDLYRATADPHARGNDVPDAHLVALMRQHGVAVIYSRDRGLRRYPGIDVRDPLSEER